MAAANPLEYAIQMERDGRAFYDDAAAATTNPLGKKMFEGLAADERDHEQVLLKVAAELAVAFSGELPKQRLVTLFGTLGEELRQQFEADMADTAVVEKARVMERASVAHYATMGQQAGRDADQAVFERLRLEETQHVEILENTLSYLNDTGHWFLWDEGSILDGG